jgi:hypothetical protein
VRGNYTYVLETTSYDRRGAVRKFHPLKSEMEPGTGEVFRTLQNEFIAISQTAASDETPVLEVSCISRAAGPAWRFVASKLQSLIVYSE